jgi:hypothetical protein
MIAMQKDWRVIARRHWSVRWWGAAVVLEFVNAALPSAQPYLPAQINPLWVSLAIGFCGAAGLACKFIAQSGLPNASD